MLCLKINTHLTLSYRRFEQMSENGSGSTSWRRRNLSDVDDAINALYVNRYDIFYRCYWWLLDRANYFLVRNGEFILSLIREIERLKLSRLTSRPGTTSMIREQDLNLALLRASLGTTAQHDPYLSRFRFILPAGPLRPLLPSLTHGVPLSTSISPSGTSIFDTQLLGTTLSQSSHMLD